VNIGEVANTIWDTIWDPICTFVRGREREERRELRAKRGEDLLSPDPRGEIQIITCQQKIKIPAH
jgi:hypothetical protein